VSKSIHYRDEKVIKAFGEKIRGIRISKGLTIEALANSVAIHVSQLARIERGETNPTLSYIILLSKILEVEASSLLQFDT